MERGVELEGCGLWRGVDCGGAWRGVWRQERGVELEGCVEVETRGLLRLELEGLGA